MPILYIFQFRQHSARPPCALIITVNIFNENGISLSLLCPVSDPS